MGSKTNISWCTSTWNPIRGCSRVSEGCRNCYAEAMAYRFSGPGMPYEGLVTIKGGVRQRQWNGNIKFVPETLDQPIRWKRPRRIFVNSMSDLFHPNVSDEIRDQIFAVMAIAKHHTFQILTKRPEIAEEYLSNTMRLDNIYQWWHSYSGTPREAEDWPLPNVHIGVSVEDINAKKRIDTLKNVPATVRFLSCEPLLGDLGMVNLHGIDWVIVGGESGHGARPMHPDWARSLRDQCISARVPFFFKQHGEFVGTGHEKFGILPRTSPNTR